MLSFSIIYAVLLLSYPLHGKEVSMAEEHKPIERMKLTALSHGAG
jgi:hypothetical protein